MKIKGEIEDLKLEMLKKRKIKEEKTNKKE